MGLLGDILMLPIRVIKLPFKVWALPFRLPLRLIFGSKKDQLESERASEKAAIEKEKKDMLKEREAEREKSKVIPFYMSGHPDDMKAVCSAVDLIKADDKTKAICASAKGGSRKGKTRRRRNKNRKGG